MSPSRREEYAQETRQAILDSAHKMFVENGYAETSLEEIVQQARVTKGALYHHFKKGKKALLYEITENLCQGAMNRVMEVAAEELSTDYWAQFLAGTEAYLDHCQLEDYRRIVFVEAPATFASTTWRALDDKYSIRPVMASFKRLMRAGIIKKQSAELLTHAFLGILNEVGYYIDKADDKQAARHEASEFIRQFLDSLRTTD